MMPPWRPPVPRTRAEKHAARVEAERRERRQRQRRRRPRTALRPAQLCPTCGRVLVAREAAEGVVRFCTEHGPAEAR